MTAPHAMTLAFKIGDDRYEVRSGLIKGTHARELRKHLDGAGFGQIMTGIADGDIDADYLAALIWLARIQRGEQVDLEAVLDVVSFDDITRFAADGDASLEPGTKQMEDDSPEV